MNRKQQMIEMRRDGATYQEIGEKFGVSKQYVHELIGKVRKRKDTADLEKIIFEGIYQLFKNDECMSYRKLATIIYGRRVEISHQNTVYQFVTGKRDSMLKIRQIKNILNYTGKSFEEVFKLRNGGANEKA